MFKCINVLCYKMLFYISGLLILLSHGVTCNQSELENAYQNVLDNFKQMERYTDSTRTALNKLGTLLGKKPGLVDKEESISTKNEKLPEVVAVPQGMEEIYKILEKYDVYKRMKSWKRPTVSQRNPLLSSVLELSYQQLPKYVPKFNMGATTVKLFNDTNTGYVVCSLTFTLDLDYVPFIMASTYHNGTRIHLNVNNCGKEVCFLRERTLGNTHCARQQFYNSMQSSVTYDPANKNGVKLLRTRLQTTLGDLGNVDSIPNAQFKNVLDTHHLVAIKCIAQDKNKTLLCTTSLDLSNNQTNDGTFKTSYHMAPKGSRIFWRTFITASSEVYPITQIRPSPTLAILEDRHSLKKLTSVLLHSSFEIILSFWKRRNAKVRIHKLVNGQPVTKFPGFQIGVNKFTEVIRVRFTTYNVLLEDAGMYVVTVSTPKRTVSKNFTLDVYERELEVFEMTETNYTVKETGFKGLNVTCRAAGNPRPKIEFYQQVFGKDYLLIYENYPKLESDDKFTILPEVHDKDEMTSRSILVQRFPGNASATHSFTIDCKAFTKYQEKHTSHHIYKYFWEN